MSHISRERLATLSVYGPQRLAPKPGSVHQTRAVAQYDALVHAGYAARTPLADGHGTGRYEITGAGREHLDRTRPAARDGLTGDELLEWDAANHVAGMRPAGAR